MSSVLNRPSLIRNGSGDRLTNPPGSVGAELEPPAIIELLHGPDQTEIPLLDQVQKEDLLAGAGGAGGADANPTALKSALGDADVLLYVTDVIEKTDKNDDFLQRVRQAKCPVLLLINKIDLADQPKLETLVEE